MTERRWPDRDTQTIFLDRDGVVVRNREDYTKSWSEVEFLPGALDALRRLSEAGLRLMIVTNQSAVGRGIVARSAVDAINDRLCDAIALAGGRIDAVLMCPHAPEENCACRKPLPGLFFQAKAEFGVDLDSAWMIGDKPSDFEAARAAGVSPILLRSGAWPADIDPPAGCRVFDDLSAAADFLLLPLPLPRLERVKAATR